GIRATVRAVRDAMRAKLLSSLHRDMTGQTLLDAGCGAGQLAVAAAQRGANVIAIDLSATLVDLARARAADTDFAGSIDFRVGDAFDPGLDQVDHIAAMDSVIHYRAGDMADILAALAVRARRQIVFTFAPRTPALAAMHAAGKLFPRADRSPAIQPVSPAALSQRLAEHPGLDGWQVGRTERIKSGFYISQAMEMTAP
ncbi:MAG: magnesium protoporphyrin IX methyltransferase, partial [Pseudomonadota bacterium]